MQHGDMFDPDWFRLAPVIRPAVQRYVLDGVLPGAFLAAVLANDVKTAIRVADSQLLEQLRPLLDFLNNACPAMCWGSTEAVANWHYIGGWRGRAAMLADFEAAARKVVMP